MAEDSKAGFARALVSNPGTSASRLKGAANNGLVVQVTVDRSSTTTWRISLRLGVLLVGVMKDSGLQVQGQQGQIQVDGLVVAMDWGVLSL